MALCEVGLEVQVNTGKHSICKCSGCVRGLDERVGIALPGCLGLPVAFVMQIEQLFCAYSSIMH